MKSGEVWTGRNTTVLCTELWMITDSRWEHLSSPASSVRHSVMKHCKRSLPLLQKRWKGTALPKGQDRKSLKPCRTSARKEDFAPAGWKSGYRRLVYRINPEDVCAASLSWTIPADSSLTARVWARPFRPMCSTNCSTIGCGPNTRLIPPSEQDTPRQEQDTEERLERKEYRQQENQGYQSEPSGSLIDTSALGAIDIFSVLMEEDHTHEYTDPAFRFGHRKKKKRRRKL